MNPYRVVRSWKFLSAIFIALAFTLILYHRGKTGYAGGNGPSLYAGMALFCACWLASLWKLSRLEKRRRRKELALLDRDSLIHAIMDGGKHAIVVADRHQIIKSFNRASERLYGYDAAHFVGRALAELGRETLIYSELEEEAKKLTEEFEKTILPNEVFDVPLAERGFY